MNKALLLSAAVVSAVSSYAASPLVSNVTVKQSEDRLVTISYTLSEGAGIVTADVLTNGVSIGTAPFLTAWGDLGVKIEPGERAIYWQPRDTWPDRVIKDGSLSVKVTAWALDNPPDYMTVDLALPSNVHWYAAADCVPYGATNDLYKSDMLLMRRIHASGVTWRMGSPVGEANRKAEREPLHHVILTNDFYIAVYQLTDRQYSIITKDATLSTSLKPKNYINYNTMRGSSSDYDWPTKGNAVAPTSVSGMLRDLTGIDTFDIPYEAQWEFTCRAGTVRDPSDAATLNTLAWTANSDYTQYGGSGTKERQKVGLLRPNAWGLYDMLGNGFEQCKDWYAEGDAFAKEGEVYIDPRGPTTGTGRVLRVASWDHQWYLSGRSAHRDTWNPSGSSSYVTCRMVCDAIVK